MENNKSYDIKLKEKQDNGSIYTITVKVPMDLGWIEDMYFCPSKSGFNKGFKLKHVKNEDGYVYFSSDVYLDTCAVYRYNFTFTANNKRMYIHGNGNIRNFVDNNTQGKLSVNFDTPDWAKGAVMYHIFVDRFKRGSNTPLEEKPRRDIHTDWNEEMTLGPNKDGIWNCDFYGGDLLGIIEKLDYIKSLGTNILYLSPIMESQSNHRYDTGDYENVDPYAGCNEDLKRLCEEAHKRGMYVVLDSVFNHTGNDSKYFNEYGSYPNTGAFQDPDSYYGGFYRKSYSHGKMYYDHWWGMPNLPVCNGFSSDWQEYIYGEGGVIDKWFNLGIDGLRLDVADELSDEFIEGIRKAVKRNKEDGLVLGEVWKNPMRMNRSYIESGRGMDSVMNYSLIDALIRYFKYNDINKLSYIIQDIKNEYPKGTIETLMNFTSTHDISRAINLFATYDFQQYGEWAWNPNNDSLDYCKNFKLTPEQYEHAKKVYEVYSFCLTFMPGIFSIFYGDEAGVQGLGNLQNRKTFPWGNEDEELLRFFRTMGNIRVNEEFLRQADIDIIDMNNRYLMFERKNGDSSALITVNRSADSTGFYVPGEYDQYDRIYSLNNSSKKELTPYGGVALVKGKKRVR